jgi:hypothetical protein
MTLDVEAELLLRSERLWLEIMRAIPAQGRRNYRRFVSLRHRIEDELSACYRLGEEQEHEQQHRFICIDCFTDTSASGEYYTVDDALWQASGGGDRMLCLRCLEQRTGHLLSDDDFEALRPSPEAWARHLKARGDAAV